MYKNDNSGGISRGGGGGEREILFFIFALFIENKVNLFFCHLQTSSKRKQKDKKSF